MFQNTYKDIVLRLNFHIKYVSMLCLAVDMVHPDTFPKTIVYVDVKSEELEDDVKLGDFKDEVNRLMWRWMINQLLCG